MPRIKLTRTTRWALYFVQAYLVLLLALVVLRFFVFR
jgi:hypothetical protein